MLFPVLIEPVKPSVGFRSIQAADLTDWDGSRDSLGARQLIVDLQLLMSKPTQCREKRSPVWICERISLLGSQNIPCRVLFK
jgi:hypothetical protein